ncbi:serine hydrolase domain-containing protein [Salipaludibacillus sp. HK11]|uniref:serine hydrolase domain-containing protein n=1 Tax=Salipaludibacillus sp. HK11 TaxID=3394320 RepID=UPI0039FC1B73
MMRPTYIRNFEKTVSEAMKKYHAPGIVARLLVNREIVYSKSFGVSKIGDIPTPLTNDTIFSIMSITKSFTATAIMQLVEKGSISLDDRVSDYLPYFHINDQKYIENPITIKQLLSHTAGFPEFYPIVSLQDRNLVKLYRGAPQYEAIISKFPDEVLSKIKNREDITRYFENVQLQYKPGEDWQYCTDAYVIAGDLLEKVTEMSWEGYINKNIFNRLKLGSTFTDPTRLNEESNKTHYYTLDESSLMEMPMPINRICAPAGFIYSSVNDMTKYLISHMDFDNSPLLNRNSLMEMQKMIAQRERNLSYGLGWRIRNYHDHKIAEHAGGYPGVAAYVTMIPEKGFGVVLFSNCDKVPVKVFSEKVTEEYIDSIC